MFEFDVALSFAGEDRSLAEAVARELSSRAVRVFYDKDQEAELWGKDLATWLHEVYGKRARHCLLFASRPYATKMWPSLERRAIQERALKALDQDYLLPIKIDDIEIPGLPSTIGYVDAAIGPQRIAEIFVRKLQGAAGASGSPTTTASQPPFAVVRQTADPSALVPGAIADAVSLIAKTPSPTYATREEAVVPYSIPIEQIRKTDAIRAARQARLQTRRGSPMFPLASLDDPEVRDSCGLRWDTNRSPEWRTQFALGFDGSYVHREFISETVRSHPIWGSGIGLFSTLDRVIGAVLFGRFLLPQDATRRSWLVLTLDRIAGHPLVFDYDDSQPRSAHLFPRRYVANVPAVRVALNFSPAASNPEVAQLALAVGEELAFYFGWEWDKAWVDDEVLKSIEQLVLPR